jgi:recombination protein RecR
MSNLDYPPAFKALVSCLKGLPGIGPRGAERIALWSLGSGRDEALGLAEALHAALWKITACPVCGFFKSEGECSLCTGANRNRKTLCVVERAMDVLPIERTGAFDGHYHVLGGRLSPLDNVGPEDLRLPALRERVEAGVEEVILALGSDVEGEATCHYLGDFLSGTGAKITRLAQGLPAGGGLEHADSLTLLRALSGRREM